MGKTESTLNTLSVNKHHLQLLVLLELSSSNLPDALTFYLLEDANGKSLDLAYSSRSWCQLITQDLQENSFIH